MNYPYIYWFSITDLNFRNLSFRQTGADTIVRVLGQDIAVLLDTQASSLTSNNFFI